MIGKVERTATEKTTSIDQDIELSQKGQIQVVPSSGKLLSIPCGIPNPKHLTLMPMSANAGMALNASTTEAIPWTDYTLHHATGASLCFAPVASSVLNADVGYRLRMDSDYNLYVAAASMSATTAASNSLLASNSLWHKIDAYANNPQKYLLVNIANSASDAFKGKKLLFSYEIRGY